MSKASTFRFDDAFFLGGRSSPGDASPWCCFKKSTYSFFLRYADCMPSLRRDSASAARRSSSSMSGVFFRLLPFCAAAVWPRVRLRSASAPTGLVRFRTVARTSSRDFDPPSFHVPNEAWNNPSESKPALPIPSKLNLRETASKSQKRRPRACSHGNESYE